MNNKREVSWGRIACMIAGLYAGGAGTAMTHVAEYFWLGAVIAATGFTVVWKAMAEDQG